jgi:hypothetical protein
LELGIRNYLKNGFLYLLFFRLQAASLLFKTSPHVMPLLTLSVKPHPSKRLHPLP